MFDSGDARHPATQTRLQTARAEGDVARSQQLSGAIQLMGVLFLASMFVGQLGFQIQQLTKETWSNSSIRSSEMDLIEWAGRATKSVGYAMLPILGLLFCVSVASHIAQTGPLFVVSRVGLDPSRVSPHHWLQRVFSPSHLIASLLDLPKLLLVLGIAGATSWANCQEIVALGGYPVSELATRLMGLILKIGFQSALVLFCFGLADYGFQWTARQRRLRMTDEQLREELRMQQANPQTTQRRQQRHREIFEVQDDVAISNDETESSG